MPIVYQHINLITGKCYIGWTTNTIDGRWNQHVRNSIKKQINTKFQNALRKYGSECWKHIVLFECDTKSVAKQKEIELIEYYNSYHNGYNSTKGGDGNNCIIQSPESNKKRRDAHLGKPKNYNRMLGKTHSTETKDKIRHAHLGKKKPWVKWSDEQIRKRALTRRALTEEQFYLIKELKNQNLNLTEISKRLDVSIHVVKKWHRIESW